MTLFDLVNIFYQQKQNKDGHFRFVEKHYSGITYGLGNNGQLWILPLNSKRMHLNFYKGIHLQTDEIEITFWEKQRCNIHSEWTDFVSDDKNVNVNF